MRYPIAAQPSTFGIANTQKPGQPYWVIRTSGSHIPMHQVQLEVRNRPQPTVEVVVRNGEVMS